MKLVKEHINERFQEDSDPITNLGIGLVKKIQEAIIGITNDRQFLAMPIISEITMFDPDNISNIANKNKLVCYTNFSIPQDAPYIEMVFKKFDIADYVIFHKTGGREKGNYYFTLKIKPKYVNAFRQAITSLKIKNIKESLNEKFQEGTDPISDLGIGLYTHRDFESVDQLYEFLAKNILAILKLKEMPKELISLSTSSSGSAASMKSKYADKIDAYIRKYLTIKGRTITEELHFIMALSGILSDGVVKTNRNI